MASPGRGDRVPASDDSIDDATATHLGNGRVDVLYEEQGFARTEWYPVERVRVRRRIITEIQTIEVEVRREEIVVEHEGVLAAQEALPVGRAPIAPEPLVMTLHREVPFIRLEVEPYEQATVRVVPVESETPISLELHAEHSRVDVTNSPATLASHGEASRPQV